MKVFRKRWSGRDDKKSKETIDLFGSCENEFAIGFQNVLRLLKRPERGPELNGAYGMHLELERGHDAEVSAATSYGPK